MPTIRDTRLDVCRALALLTIFIDHVPGTFAERFTLRNWGFADAAEVFVLISGIAVGLAYAPRFASGRGFQTSLKVWRRAGVLYCAHIMTTVTTLTIFCAASITLQRPDLLKLNNIEALIDEPPKALVGVGLLGHQLGYNNILSMYAVIMLAAPLIIWGARRSMSSTLAASVLLWFFAGWRQWAPPNYPTEGYWFLNPLSWQLLFVIGIAGTMYVKRGGRLPQNGWLTAIAVAYLVFAFGWVHSPMWGQEGWKGVPLFLLGFDKTFLALPRLLDALALAYLATCIPRLSSFARVSPNHPLAVFGRHSLPIFIFGTVLAMLCQVLKATLAQGWMDDALLLTAGIGAQFGFAYLVGWLKRQTSDAQARHPQGQRDGQQLQPATALSPPAIAAA